MAVTALSRRRPRRALGTAALVLWLSGGFPLFADRAADIRTQISNLAASLASNNPSDPMASFDKSYVHYDKLSGYFQGLANFQVENEVDVTDEEDADEGAKLTVAWTLTLTDTVTNRTDRRAADISVRLVLKNGKWKIVEFAPIEIFNPLAKWNRKP